MSFWSDKSAAASNIRLFEPTNGWKAHDDQVNEQGHIVAQGSRYAVELALHNALNANNLVLLTLPRGRADLLLIRFGRKRSQLAH
jgi:hypothetical protein